MRSKTILVGVAGVAVLGMALAGCSSKSTETPGAAADGAVKTGQGISGTTITLTAEVDLNGPFKVNSEDESRGYKLYWEEQNAAGGVCETYDVKINVVSHDYDVQKAVTVFNQTSPETLAYQDFVGGSHTAAVLEEAEANNLLLSPSSTTHTVLASPVVTGTWAAYDVDLRIVFQWLLEQGEVAEGDTVGVIYNEGDYGQAALEGAQEFAEAHDITLVEAQVKATDSDMTAAVQSATSAGASAVLLAGTPPQLASVATILQGAGSDIAIGGSNPTISSSLLGTPAADYLAEHFVGVSYVTTYEEGYGKDLFDRLTEANPGATLTSQAAIGYQKGAIMHKILEAACAAGDLTPAGVVEARANIGIVSLPDLGPDMDYSKLGESPTKSGYVVALDESVTGGLKVVSDGLYELK